MFDSTVLGLTLVGLGLGVLCLLHLLRLRSKYLFSLMYSPEFGNLPRVAHYGTPAPPRSPDLPAVLSSEYPSAQFINPHHMVAGYPYTRLAPWLSPAEKSLFTALEQVLAKQPYRLLVKVRLADILKPDDNLTAKEHQAAIERIAQKRLDFVICERESFAVLGVIKLLREARKLDTQIRSRFVAAALEAAGIPLLELFTQESYELTPLRQSLNHAFQLNLKCCPQCGGNLVRARAKRGVLSGKILWACQHYPRCKTLLPEEL
jgi:hypothetical protein